ncbi:histidine phosphatase superfamily [Aspergillus spectabilis]
MLLPIAATLLGGLTTASAETILGVTIFSRHGDRTSKHYPDYTLTNLGAQQNLQVGSYYRSRYLSPKSDKQILGISPDVYVPAQIFASAPDQQGLQNTATAFLQGLYPPLSTLNDQEAGEQTLSNGTTLSTPLNGYQYVTLHPESSDTVWIKGDGDCYKVENIGFSPERMINSTRPFYKKFASALENVTDIDSDYLSYENAYDIYDLLNTALIHNNSQSIRDAVSDADLLQLRTLADSREFSRNWDDFTPLWSVTGRSLAGAISTRLNETIATRGDSGKFSFMAGSYDAMLQFFALYGLINIESDFYGIPQYASTMVFELFTERNTTVFPNSEDELRVRFLFRNSSDPTAELRAFPLFGGTNVNDTGFTTTSLNRNLTSLPLTLPYSEFDHLIRLSAIDTIEQWCTSCSSQNWYCAAFDYNQAPTSIKTEQMSNAVAGVIGAMVALAAIGFVGASAFFVVRRRWAKAQAVTMEAAMEQKALYETVSEIEMGVEMQTQTQMQTGRVSVRSGQQP